MRVPSSMTRLVGMLKKSVMLPALRAIAANMRSRQRAHPGTAFGGGDQLAREEERRLHHLDVEARAGAELERPRDVGPVEEAVVDEHPPAPVAELLADHALPVRP